MDTLSSSPSPSTHQGNDVAAKYVDDSKITLAQMIFPRDTNSLHMATAGTILKAIDVAASLTAGKHSGKKIVTASLDCMDFVNHAYMWELLSTHCMMTKTWRTSMEVQVDVIAENTRTNVRRQIAIGYLVFVALDDVQFKPTPFSPLLIVRQDERQRAQMAEIRKQNRLAEKANQAHHDETLIDDVEQPETIVRTMTPDDSNIHSNVFGGVILEMIHEAAEKAALRYANGPVIAVRQDRMSFDQPAYIGEEVKSKAVLTRSWNTSMEIQVDVTARDHKTGEIRNVASSYLVFIAQDAAGNPRPVSPFQPNSTKQQQRWNEAAHRQLTRLQERSSQR